MEQSYNTINHVDEKSVKLSNGDKVTTTIPQENHQQYAEVVLNGIRLSIEPDDDGGLVVTSDKGETCWIRG